MEQLVISSDIKKSFIAYMKSSLSSCGYPLPVSSTLRSPIPLEGQVQITQLGGSGRRTLVTQNVSFVVSVWSVNEAIASEIARTAEALFFNLDQLDGAEVFRHSSYGSPVLTFAPDSGKFVKVSFTVSFDYSLEVKDL